MKKAKRLIGMLLALAMLLSMMPVSVIAEEIDPDLNYCGDKLTWTVSDDGAILTIEGEGDMDNYTSSPAPWAAYTGTITTINLPDGLTSIGEAAFSSCGALTSIEIPASVTVICDRAFDSCTFLTEVCFYGDAPTIVGENTFDKAVTLRYTPETAGWIDSAAYDAENSTWNGYALTVWQKTTAAKIGDVYYHTLASAIDAVAEYGTIELLQDNNEEIVINKKLTINRNGNTAFSILRGEDLEIVEVDDTYVVQTGVKDRGNCGDEGDGSNLQWLLTIDNNLYITGAGVMVFEDEDNAPWSAYAGDIKSVSLPEGLTVIGARAFANCTNLPEIEIPDSVVSIDAYAFTNCDALKNVTFGDGLTTIGNGAFYDCDALFEVSMGKNTKTIGEKAFADCDSLYDVDFGDSVTTIGREAFKNCVAMEKVKIPTNIATIEAKAFSGCSSLVAAHFFGSPAIKHNVFEGCTALVDVFFDGDAPVELGTAAFEKDIVTLRYNLGTNGWTESDGLDTAAGTWNGYKLVAHIRTGSVACIGDIHFLTLQEAIDAAKDGVVIDLLAEIDEKIVVSKHLTIERNGFSVTDLTAGENYGLTVYDTVYIIGAFQNFGYCGAEAGGKNLYWTLTEDGILTITGSGAMADFTAEDRAPWHEKAAEINTVIMDEGITTLGNYAFADCTALETFAIGEEITSVGTGCFENCSVLTDVKIPNNVKFIGANAFYGCASLKKVIIPDSVTEIGNRAFMGCSNLETVVLGDGLTIIRGAAFANCTGLLDITLGKNIVFIESCAFTDCPATKIIIPASMKDIAPDAFTNCTMLREVYFEGAMPVLKKNSFSEGATFFYIPGQTNWPPHGNPVKNEWNGFRVMFWKEMCAARIDEIHYGTLADAIDAVMENGTVTVLKPNTEKIEVSKTLTLVLENEATIDLENCLIPGPNYQIDKIDDGVYNVWTRVLEWGYCGDEDEGKNLKWFVYRDGYMIIEGKGTMKAYDREVAPWVKKYGDLILTVELSEQQTNVGARAFDGSEKLLGVNIPDSVVSIDAYAFADCKALEKITGYNNVATIGKGAFTGCDALRVFLCDPALKTIGEEAFADCDVLEELVLNEGLSTIGRKAFMDCASLHQITIPETVTEIGAYAFLDCAGLESVTFNGIVKKLTHNAFDGCDKLTAVYFESDAPAEIGDAAFEKDVVTLYYIPGTKGWTDSEAYDAEAKTWHGYKLAVWVEKCTARIGEEYFVTLAEAIEAAKEDAIIDLLKDTDEEIVISKVLTIKRGKFTASKISADAEHYLYEYVNCETHGACYEIKPMVCNSGYCGGEGDGKNLAWSLKRDGTLIITGSGAMATYSADDDRWGGQKDDIKKVVLPEGQTTIDDYAFYNCENLTEINIPDSIVSVDIHAFSGCTSLEKLTLGKGVSAIGYAAFSGTGLATMELGDSVKELGGRAFADCAKLEKVTIGKNLTTIGEEAFQSCEALTEVYFAGNAPTKIGDAAFEKDPVTLYYIPGMIGWTDSEAYNAEAKTWNGYKLSVWVEMCVARIGDEYFGTLGAAVEAVEENGTIELLKNTDEAITIDKHMTINRNGFTASELDVVASRKIVETETAYTVVYNSFVINFVDEDGTVLQTGEVVWGEIPAYTEETPVKAATAQYTYTFAGWTPEITAVTGEATYTAVYESALNAYTITFTNHDGVMLQSSEVTWGETPVYTKDTPTKLSTEQYEYKFKGWYPEIVAVDGEAVYTAVFEEFVRNYTVVFEDAGVEVLRGMYPYGTIVDAPDAPNKPGFRFVGWFVGATEYGEIPVTGNMTISARWEEIPVVAMIGQTKYYSLTDAINAVAENGTIELKKDTVEPIMISKALTINRNGYTAAAISAGQSYKLVETDAAYVVSRVATVIPGVVSVPAKTLITSGILQLRLKVTFTDFIGLDSAVCEDFVIENGGVLYWTGNKPTESQAVLGTETSELPLNSGELYNGLYEYHAYLEVNSWEYAKKYHFRPYIMVNGQPVYGEVVSYGVLDYVDSQMRKTSTTENNKIKSLLAALLKYGAAAQIQFGVDTDNLADAVLETYVSQGKLPASALAMNWTDNFLTDLDAPTTSMTSNFVRTGKLSSTGNTLVLQGAISIKSYMSIGKDKSAFANATDARFYFWDEETYAEIKANNGKLTKENASYSTNPSALTQYSDGSWEYVGYSNGIYAMDYDDTMYYAMCVTDKNGVEHCSGVITYSPEAYAANMLAKSSTSAALRSVIQWMVVYGERAKAYFG